MTISRSGSLAVITKYICERNAFVSPGPKIRQRLKKLFILTKTREKKYNGILLAADSQLGAWKISVFRNWKSTIPREDPLLTILSSPDIYVFIYQIRK